jgi:thiamine-monophosphate kinase
MAAPEAFAYIGLAACNGVPMPLKEKLLIERIRRAATTRAQRAGQGIGDDCAVLPLPRGHEALVTTDFSLEDVHFRREWHPPDSIGHRCLARGLSDIAAMGGIPRAAFLSLALPAELPQSWVDKFVAGLLKLATQFSVSLAGGDTAQSPGGVLADIMVVGSVPTGQAILRSGARPGDFIYVTGTLGSAVRALNQLRDGKKLRPRSHLKHFYPEPRVTVGQFLRERNLASAMIDISDGLSTDLGHICEESGTGAVVYAEALPASSGGSQNHRLVSGHGFSRAVRRSTMTRALAPEGNPRESQALSLALHGGDEYELLFTAPPNRRIPNQVAGVAISRIGEILSGKQMRLAAADGKTHPLKPAGWEHFVG